MFCRILSVCLTSDRIWQLVNFCSAAAKRPLQRRSFDLVMRDGRRSALRKTPYSVCSIWEIEAGSQESPNLELPPGCSGLGELSPVPVRLGHARRTGTSFWDRPSRERCPSGVLVGLWFARPSERQSPAAARRGGRLPGFPSGVLTAVQATRRGCPAGRSGARAVRHEA